MAEVQAVFDPYLDNKALGVLMDIVSLTASGLVSNGLRLLSGEKKARPPRPQLTKTFVDNWFNEHSITGGEVRLMPDSEHRRFILLEWRGGSRFILGMSLNSTNKNEAFDLEPDADDRAFFETVWASAAQLS